MNIRDLFREDNSTLFVLSSTRLSKEFCLHYLDRNLSKTPEVADFFCSISSRFSDDRFSFLPYVMSMRSFLDYVIHYSGKQVPLVLRRVFLSNAISRVKSRHNLDFLISNGDFVTYLESSSFLLEFFDVLRSNNVVFGQHVIDRLRLADSYEDYRYHLDAISDIFTEYNIILEKHGFVSSYDDYCIVEGFVNSFRSIHVEVSGILSPREHDILRKISSFSDVFLHFRTTTFNKFNMDRYVSGNDVDHFHVFHLNSNSMRLSTPLPRISGHIKLYDSCSQMGQMNLAFFKAHEWIARINSGECSELDFALILPDESFGKTLRIFDRFGFFNFAMGLDILGTPEFQSFDRIYSMYMKHHDFSSLGVDYPEDISGIENIILDCFKNSEVLNAAISILADFKHLLRFDLRDSPAFEDIFTMIYDEIRRVTVSDVVSGKIRVMGVLETRGLSFKEILLLDFNESHIARLDNDDFFINTSIRRSLGIPTLVDKENLQRHHYYSLIQSSSSVILSFVRNEASALSTLYYYIADNPRKEIISESIDVMFSYYDASTSLHKCYVDDEFGEYDYHGLVSATSMDAYRDCKRKFFYRYVKCIRDDISNDNISIGDAIHDALRIAYTPFIDIDLRPSDVDIIQDSFMGILSSVTSNLDASVKSILQVLMPNIAGFFESEKDRAGMGGFRVVALEKEVSAQLFDHNLRGRIDRIDMIGHDKFFVLDYKHGSSFKDNAHRSLQLPFYSILFEHEYGGAADGHFYYYGVDCAGDRMVSPKSIGDLKRAAVDLIHDIGSPPLKTDNLSTCVGCEYRILCDR